MDISDTISLVLAGLTFLGIIIALGLGIWSIRETRNLQRIQYRENFLDNISDWLSDISEGSARYNLKNISDTQQAFANAENAKLHWNIVAGNLLNEDLRLKNKGLDLVRCFKNEEDPLPKEIKILLKILASLSKIHDKYRQDFLGLPDNFTNVLTLLNKQRAEEKKAEKKLTVSIKKIRNQVSKLRYAKTFL